MKTQREGTLNKIIVGVAIAVIPVLIFYYLGIAPNGKSDDKSQRRPESDVIGKLLSTENINYSQFTGIYVGESINNVAYQKGHTVLDLKEIDNTTKKVRLDLAWSNGLYGEGRLYGNVTGYKIEAQGTINSNVTGAWDAELTLYLRPLSASVDGTFRLLPRAWNPNGTQNGKFNLRKAK